MNALQKRQRGHVYACPECSRARQVDDLCYVGQTLYLDTLAMPETYAMCGFDDARPFVAA